MNGPKAPKARSFQEIEGIVKQLLMEVGYLDGYGNVNCQVDIEELIELKLGFKIQYYRELPILPGAQKKNHADCLPDEGVIRVEEWLLTDLPKFRLILAHELAHLLLHSAASNSSYSQLGLPHLERAVALKDSRKIMEEEAWIGAAVILLPRALFEPLAEEGLLLSGNVHGTTRKQLIAWLCAKTGVPASIIMLAMRLYREAP